MTSTAPQTLTTILCAKKIPSAEMLSHRTPDETVGGSEFAPCVLTPQGRVLKSAGSTLQAEEQCAARAGFISGRQDEQSRRGGELFEAPAHSGIKPSPISMADSLAVRFGFPTLIRSSLPTCPPSGEQWSKRESRGFWGLVGVNNKLTSLFTGLICRKNGDRNASWCRDAVMIHELIVTPGVMFITSVYLT